MVVLFVNHFVKIDGLTDAYGVLMHTQVEEQLDFLKSGLAKGQRKRNVDVMEEAHKKVCSFILLLMFNYVVTRTRIGIYKFFKKKKERKERSGRGRE
jgi:hypothetical protein